FPSAGAHTTFPVLRQPVPDFSDNTSGAVRDFVVITNESTANECQENRQLVYIADVTTESKPFNVSNYQVPEAPQQFCQVGGRFGSHSSSENFTPIYYRRIMFFAWFNAGVRAVDIRDPFNPVEIAFYIPATTANTDVRCRDNNDPSTCKIAFQTNNVDVDDDDVPPVLDVDVVGLDRNLTGRRVVVIAAPRVRVGRGGRDVERDLHRIEGIANIDSPHTGVEPREEHDAPVVDRREVLAARVGPEAAAHLTELLRGLRHLVVGNVERLRLGGDVSDVDE